MQTSHLDFTGYMGRRIHLGVAGSVAAYKALPLLRRLLATGAGAGVTLTEAARQFVAPLSFEALGADPVFTDLFLPDSANFAHLAPAQTADLLAGLRIHPARMSATLGSATEAVLAEQRSLGGEPTAAVTSYLGEAGSIVDLVVARTHERMHPR